MRTRKTGGALRIDAANDRTSGRIETMARPVKTVAALTARPGKAEALQALLLGMLESSRAEPGTLRYDLWRDRADTGRFVLDELYADADAVAAHRATPHFQDYLARIGDLADRHALLLDPVRVG